MNNSNQSKLTLIPVMIAFFTMGFVDLVGAVSNNMQEDFGLSDSAANFFPSLVLFWFLIFSVPTGMLMNKIGRKKTVLLSVVITTLAVLLPLFDSFIILTHLFIFCNTFSKIILHCAKAKIRQLCRRTIFKRIQKPKTLIFAIDKSAKSVKMIIVKGIDGKSRRICGKKRDGNKG